MTDFIHCLDHQLFFRQVKISVAAIVETRMFNNPGCIRRSNNNILLLQFQSSLTFGLRQLTLLTSTTSVISRAPRTNTFIQRKNYVSVETNTQHD